MVLGKTAKGRSGKTKREKRLPAGLRPINRPKRSILKISTKTRSKIPKEMRNTEFSSLMPVAPVTDEETQDIVMDSIETQDVEIVSAICSLCKRVCSGKAVSRTGKAVCPKCLRKADLTRTQAGTLSLKEIRDIISKNTKKVEPKPVDNPVPGCFACSSKENLYLLSDGGMICRRCIPKGIKMERVELYNRDQLSVHLDLGQDTMGAVALVQSDELPKVTKKMVRSVRCIFCGSRANTNIPCRSGESVCTGCLDGFAMTPDECRSMTSDEITDTVTRNIGRKENIISERARCSICRAVCDDHILSLDKRPVCLNCRDAMEMPKNSIAKMRRSEIWTVLMDQEKSIADKTKGKIHH